MSERKNLRLAFDIDGTLCNNTNGKYPEAEPYQDMIDLINKLYDEGNYIIFTQHAEWDTVRGFQTKQQPSGMH